MPQKYWIGHLKCLINIKMSDSESENSEDEWDGSDDYYSEMEDQDLQDPEPEYQSNCPRLTDPDFKNIPYQSWPQYKQYNSKT